MKFFLETDFNYCKYTLVKKITILLFVVCYASIILTIGIFAATIFVGTAYEAVAFTVSLMGSGLLFDFLFRKLYKKIFSKRVKIFRGKTAIKLWIGGKEIVIQKAQIKKIKAKAVSNRLRHGGRMESTKLIIYTTAGTFHFTNDQAIYNVHKLLKFAPIKK